MRLFGFDLTLKRANALQPVYGGGERGWQTWSIGGEPFMGGFQQDAHLPRDAVLANWTVFACMTLIAGDVAKMRVKLMQRDGGGLWSETENPAFSPVLRRPNSYQTRQKFLESWIFSKLAHGNAYILKERDARQVVVALYVLDPQCVKPLVATNGDVYYELKADYLAHRRRERRRAGERDHSRSHVVPAPSAGRPVADLRGRSRRVAGPQIQTNSARFFANMSRPAGILTSPSEQLSPMLAAEYKRTGKQNYGPGARGARQFSAPA
jgi:phage portal protein BeeE